MSTYARVKLETLVALLAEKQLIDSNELEQRVQQALTHHLPDSLATSTDALEDLLESFAEVVWAEVERQVILPMFPEDHDREWARERWSQIRTRLLHEIQQRVDDIMEIVDPARRQPRH